MRQKRLQTAGTLALATLTVSFVLGAAAGTACAVRLVETGELSLRWLLPGYVQILDTGEGAAGLLPLFWDALRWPLLVWLLGFTALGVWMIPLLFALRGFFLAFCTAGLAGALGDGGLALGATLFGLGSLVSVPVFFALGVMSWTCARQLAGHFLPHKQDKSLYGAAFWVRSAAALLLLCLCSGAEFLLFPFLLRGLSTYLNTF